MAKSTMLSIYEILRKYSDENNPLTRKEIESFLSLNYDISFNRNTFTEYIHEMQNLDMDIFIENENINGKIYRYYLGERTFEKSEIHLLCNAVYATHFIPDEQASKLIIKLLATQSKYVADNFRQNIFFKNERKSINKQFFLNIDILLGAIQDKKPLSLNYMKYNLDKKLVVRKDTRYIIYPYYIVYDNENYYVLCKSGNHDDISHYRIDKMQDIKECDLPFKELEESFNPYDYIKSKIYMYGGEVDQIKLKCDNFILDYLIDKFGQDIKISKCDENHFFANIKASKEGIIYLVLQFVKYCTILEPLYLRNEVKMILNNSIKNYID